MNNLPVSRYLLLSLPVVMPVVMSAVLVWSGMSAIAALPPAPIGTVETVKGKGWGKTAVGSRYDKLVGDLVILDEVLGTGKNSNMKLTFIDGTVMSLGEDAEIIVDEMVYDPDDTKDNRVVLRLGVGAFYFVSGQVAKDKVTIITPTATIGIRGTELVINVSKDGSTAVGVSKGHAYMDSRSQGGGHTEIEVGNTARSNGEGNVGKSFPGIDFTGDDDVDRNIPGVADWLDEEQEEDETKQLSEFGEKKDEGEDENEDVKGFDGEDKNDEDRQEQDQAEFETEEDEDGKEINLAENYGSDDGDSEGDKDGGSESGKEGGKEGGEGGSEGGDGGSEGGDGGSEGDDGGSEGDDGGSEGDDGGSEGDDGGDDTGDDDGDDDDDDKGDVEGKT